MLTKFYRKTLFHTTIVATFVIATATCNIQYDTRMTSQVAFGDDKSDTQQYEHRTIKNRELKNYNFQLSVK